MTIFTKILNGLILWGLRCIALPIGVVSVAAIIVCLAPASRAPEKDLDTIEDVAGVSLDSLAELYAFRDRLNGRAYQATTVSYLSTSNRLPHFPPRNHRFAHIVQARIHIEETAQAHWRNAQTLAIQAVRLRERKPSRLAHLEQSQQLWQAAISHLQHISSESFLAQAAANKIADYQNQQIEDVHRHDAIRSTFLVSIAEQTKIDPERIHISVCTLELDECHRLNGDRPPVSPASLIKVPVAVALMQKLAEEDIPPSTPIYIHPRNYTEDASDIQVGNEQPLHYVVERMINQSSNVAINQLVDYLGFDYINSVLSERGYGDMFVGSKLIGDRIEPKRLGRKGTNRITTDALTAMMAEIYQQLSPGDSLLVEALSTQTDDRMGRSAFTGDDILWLGEKTGWNSRVLGATVAVMIGDNHYVLTVALDNTTNTKIMRDIMQDIADHILENDGF